MKYALLSASLFLAAAVAVPARAATFDPDYILSDSDLTNKNGLTLDGIQSFLTSKGGALAAYVTQDLDGATKRASDIIHRVAQTFSISPKFILVMLQKEQSLVTDRDPVQGQLDWATGYAVCDSCNVNSAGVSRFKGFAKQVDSMAQQFQLGYLPDLASKGTTVTGIGPGRSVTIDGVSVTPVNNATAAMYTYTPHLEGNKNAWTIWNNWFSHPDYPSGTLLRDEQTGSYWMVRAGRLRRVASESVRLSLFPHQKAVTVGTATVESYERGPDYAFPNYSLVKTETGDVYLLVDETRRRFISLEDLSRFGYAPEEVLAGTEADLMGYIVGETISFSTAYPQGVIYKHPSTGSLYYVLNNKRFAIVSDAIKTARYASWRIRTASEGELEGLMEGPAVTFPDGSLVRVATDPTVYVISDGKRLPIIDEATFLALGYDWGQVRVVDAPSIEVHAPGALLTIQ